MSVTLPGWVSEPDLAIEAWMPMRALTLWQPWASAMALGLKRIETRSWPTSYRGPLAIHAANRKPRATDVTPVAWIELGVELGVPSIIAPADPRLQLPRGAFVCIVRLVDCIPTEKIGVLRGVSGDVEVLRTPMEVSSREQRWGNYGPGRYAWITEPALVFEQTLECPGQRGLWHVGGGELGPYPCEEHR